MQKYINLLRTLNWNDLKFFLEVARCGRVTSAAKRLGVDYTTVSRRIASLESALGTLLFEKSRNTGFNLTSEGVALRESIQAIEALMQNACEEITGTDVALSGKVRIGCTEGFGGLFLAPQLTHFQKQYPAISIDLLAVPHFVNLTNREADIGITLERPTRGPFVSTKLCDYRLQLYATADYLAQHQPIRCVNDLAQHSFINYVADLTFSNRLHYLDQFIHQAKTPFCTTGAISQYFACLQGQHLAILPCFIADQDPRLQAVLPDEVRVTNSFWISCHEDFRKLKRIRVIWDYIRAAAEHNEALFMGHSTELQLLPTAQHIPQP